MTVNPGKNLRVAGFGVCAVCMNIPVLTLFGFKALLGGTAKMWARQDQRSSLELKILN
jgi:hypothetical protein